MYLQLPSRPTRGECAEPCTGRDYRALSLWHETAATTSTPRPPLPGPASYDVAMVGAGLTGLWTAYYLPAADPRCASRCSSPRSPASAPRAATAAGAAPCSPPRGRRSPRAAAPTARCASTARCRRPCARSAGSPRRRASTPTTNAAARSSSPTRAVQLARLPEPRSRPRARVGPPRTTSGCSTPPRRAAAVARAGRARRDLHPALRGDPPRPAGARAGPGRRGLGVALFEQTAVRAIEPGVVRTEPATCAPRWSCAPPRATPPRCAGLRRAIAPVYSLMVATEPLPEATWDAIGLADRPTFTDGRHLIIYGQRTADGRIAFGGRGAPYHFGSRIRPSLRRGAARLRRAAHGARPDAPAARRRALHPPVGRRLGIARDWAASVGLDRATGSAGPAATSATAWPPPTSPAAPCADLVIGADTDLVSLPWVGHRSRAGSPSRCAGWASTPACG